MKKHLQNISQQLENRKTDNAFRTIKITKGLIDFCSNDYLGFASEKDIHIFNQEFLKFGATGSRLISGNNQLTENLEEYLADFYRVESALLFNSGYSANLGFFSTVPKRGDTVIYDELIHASIRDGIQLGNANSFSFIHNDLSSLKAKILKSSGNIFLVVESVYSMDGDVAPLREIAGLCKQYQIALIVDEAHAVGIFGKGLGLVAELNLIDDVFARVVTFGKAYGTHGAAILGGFLLRDYLINFCRSFIYTTALPLHTVLTIKKAHEFLLTNKKRIEQLNENIEFFKLQIQKNLDKSSQDKREMEVEKASPTPLKDGLRRGQNAKHKPLNPKKSRQALKFQTIHSNSAIQSMLVPGNNEVKKMAELIQQQGFDVRPILYPTVLKGEERLRICLHSFNTKQQISKLISACLL